MISPVCSSAEFERGMVEIDKRTPPPAASAMISVQRASLALLAFAVGRFIIMGTIKHAGSLRPLYFGQRMLKGVKFATNFGYPASPPTLVVTKEGKHHVVA